MTTGWLIDEKPITAEQMRRVRLLPSSPADTKNSSSAASGGSALTAAIALSTPATLKIAAARREDSALYTCLASNRFGSAQWRLQLLVEEPPARPAAPQPALVGSRSAQLSWLAPFNGNSEITKYWITCHSEQLREYPFFIFFLFLGSLSGW